MLTALPIEPRVSGDVAAATLERVRRYVQFVLPRAATYTAAAARCGARGLRSSSIFDALHVIPAENEGADVLLTFDVADFLRLAEPDGPRVIAPPDPPGLPAA